MHAAIQEYAELSRRIDELAANCDDQFQDIFYAIRQLMSAPMKTARPIGYVDTGRRRFKSKSRIQILKQRLSFFSCGLDSGS
jgi:hypothetical protein